jgi:hypothetical protein
MKKMMIDIRWYIVASLMAAALVSACDNHGHDHHHEHVAHHHDHQDIISAADSRQLQGTGNAPWNIHRCSTPETTPEEDQKINEIVLAWVAKKNANKGNQGQGSLRGSSDLFDRRLVGDFPTVGVVVPVVFHVIREEGTGPGPSELVPSSMAHLSNTFASAGFSFNLISQTLTYNTEWYNAASNQQGHADMKAALRQGGGETLNIYACAATGTLGWAYIWTTRSGAASTTDAVIINDTTYPGGSYNGFNEGDTLTHEGQLVGVILMRSLCVLECSRSLRSCVPSTALRIRCCQLVRTGVDWIDVIY